VTIRRSAARSSRHPHFRTPRTGPGSRSKLPVAPVRLRSCTRSRWGNLPGATRPRLLHDLQHTQRGQFVRRSATDRRVARRQFIKAPDVGFGLCSFEHPTCGSPECETNQRPRTRSPFFACTLCSRGDSMRLDGPGRGRTSCWFKLNFLSCIAAVLSSEAQGCSRQTKDGHRIAHEPNTCVVSANFQRDSHFQRARIRFTVLTRYRAFDAKRERLNNT